MKELDKNIAEALRREDADLFAEVGDEPSVFDMLLETFRGKHRWLNLLGAFWTLVFLVLGIAAAIAFFQAKATREMLMWASACTLCMLAVALLKVWFWMEMQRIALMREIKRVELQIACLATRLRE